MMLAARGIPARLVTGSYGGEAGLFSQSIVVRGGNLHAWVEADLDGTGFAVLDPTPPAGVPPATSRGSFLRRLVTLGREIEFFYDRRILGFESLDQQRVLEAARERLSGCRRVGIGLEGSSAGRRRRRARCRDPRARRRSRHPRARMAPAPPSCPAGHEGVRRAAPAARPPRRLGLARDAALRGRPALRGARSRRAGGRGGGRRALLRRRVRGAGDGSADGAGPGRALEAPPPSRLLSGERLLPISPQRRRAERTEARPPRAAGTARSPRPRRRERSRPGGRSSARRSIGRGSSARP